MDVPSWGELTGQVLGLMESRLLDPLEILLDSDLCGIRSVAAGRAGALAEDLLGEDDQVAAMTAIRLVAALYPGDGPFDPPASWWLTPLGRITARRAGHPGADAVSYAVAGAMLGVTRQGVHDLVSRGKLARHPDGGVTVRSVRDRLGQRGGSHDAGR